MPEPSLFKSDVLVIGSGVAGLSFSLYLPKSNSVNMIAKSYSRESSTLKAQGGIACVTDAKDSFEEHIADTIQAGDGLCDDKVVEMVIRDAPDRINDLKKWGVKFSGGNRKPELGREGGHSKRRILHRKDRTGEELEKKLLANAEKSRNVNMFPHNTAVNLIKKGGRCRGAYVLDNKTLKVNIFLAKMVVVATGGCGKVYLYTSNPDVATGDGIAMACRLGAKIANMEFIQFHPTCLYSSRKQQFLITEAMRGEGAVLLDSKGQKFMKRYADRGDLAPRDIVARAIDNEMKIAGTRHLWLDIHSYRDPDFIKKRFPSIYKELRSIGVDITRDSIPVVPAAHYCCGGIHVDTFGLTNVKGLMALGEVSHTGLHGANRLASNSLLEALVLSHRAAGSVQALIANVKITDAAPWKYTGTRLPREQVFLEHNWLALRRVMWNYVGVVRTDRRLREAKKRMEIIEREVDYHYWKYVITPGLIEMRNLVHVARIIIECAMKRKESRGLNYNVDHPRKKKEFGHNTYI